MLDGDVLEMETALSEMITIPRAEYDRLREAAEDLADIATYNRVKADLAAGREELSHPNSSIG